MTSKDEGIMKGQDDDIHQMFKSKMEIVLTIDKVQNKTYIENDAANVSREDVGSEKTPKDEEISNGTLHAEPIGTCKNDNETSLFQGNNHWNSVAITSTSKPLSVGYRKWFVVVAGFASFVLVAGFPFNMSVLYVEWLEEFGKSNSETALVQSICTGLFLAGGFISGIVVTKFGPRKCGIIGGVLSSLGLALSYFANSILFLVICLGVISGSGFSLCYISASSCVGMHFDGKQKMLALAVVSFGSGVGASVFPIILETFTNEYGWRGTLLIISGIMLNLVVNGCLFSNPVKFNRRKNSQNNNNKTETYNDKISAYDNDNSSVSDLALSDRYVHENDKKCSKNILNGNTNDELCQVDTKRVSFITSEIKRINCKTDITEDQERNLKLILKEIITNKIFIAYTITIGMSLSSINAALIFFIDYYQSKGIQRSDAITIYLIMNMVNAFFRLFPGFLKQLPHISVLAIPAVSTLLGSISTLALTFVGSSFALNTAAACGFGLCMGGLVTVMAVSIIKLVGQENYSAGLGISMGVVGIMNSAAGPLSGYIRDATGTYDISFFCTSAILFLASVSFTTIMVVRYFVNKETGSRFDFELTIRRISRRRSSILPWKKKSVNFPDVSIY